MKMVRKTGTVPIFLKLVTVTIFLLSAAAAQAQITVLDAWARATPPGAKIGAGYLVIRNGGAADRNPFLGWEVTHRADTIFTNSLYAPGTPAGSCRNHA